MTPTRRHLALAAPGRPSVDVAEYWNVLTFPARPRALRLMEQGRPERIVPRPFPEGPRAA